MNKCTRKSTYQGAHITLRFARHSTSTRRRRHHPSPLHPWTSPWPTYVPSWGMMASLNVSCRPHSHDVGGRQTPRRKHYFTHLASPSASHHSRISASLDKLHLQTKHDCCLPTGLGVPPTKWGNYARRPQVHLESGEGRGGGAPFTRRGRGRRACRRSAAACRS